jgi:undecaprenyl-phosphate 4-deoxy-4-formamido-L-arabinose transferase
MTSCSIVVPVYNSEKTLEELISRLSLILPRISSLYEVILVNDGSRDTSWQVICNLSRQYPWVRGINMMRNYGQHNALLCGVRSARYEVTVTMDDDLQHPPEEIPLLIAKLAEGYDVVYGLPKKLPHSLWRNLFSRLTKKILAMVMGIPTVREIGAFRAFRTHLRNAFTNFQSPNVILDVLLSWGTTSFSTVPVEEAPRATGSSNYNFSRLAKQALLILTGYSTLPLRFASIVGFSVTIFGICVLLYVIILSLTEGSIPGFPFLASIISIFSGAQMFAIGIFGEYLARIFDRSMDRPTYIVEEVTGEEIEKS